ncbi:secondary thiamine-phosphate synthase enzyme YjbQ [Acetobacter conturbans]|uniref:YjbQ family protein n=1 Tax=Acetobacter conturbans TaxID=1737472 RepID=A0ABX0JYN3_9PROT|nr:secondary thiamine-phosphate synthase enzyme YjbQ [Acetobacter conturbans]NHN87550.1 YjbQ family protein [Acetobacter conturbans]
MEQHTHRLTVRTHGKGLLPVTRPVLDWVSQTGVETGLLTLWCPHTSCSLTVQENADPTVREDIATFFETLVPEQSGRYLHSTEGSDDMPAHLRTMLTHSGLTIPVMDGEPVLGTWQGIYLFEHRRAPHQRQVILHLLGD